MKNILKEPVAILGFGTEGQEAFKFLKKLGIKDITICDEKDNAKIPKGAKSHLGEFAFNDLSGYQTIIRSPGVRYDLIPLQLAREAGSHITSMTKLTLEFASERVTAITGTNGKTTTTAMCENILRAHYGERLIVGGNDRKPILQEAMDHPDRPILIEASSFQFSDISTSPYIAAVLNITPNHLDWHKNMEDYINAKSNMLRHQKITDWAVLNANNENSAKLAHTTPAQQFWIGQKNGENWAVWEDGYLKLSFGGNIENIVHFDQLIVKTHPDNILFVAAVAKLHFVPTTTIEEQMKLFKGVEDRLEFIRTLNDVHFYNDSSSTSPDSVLIALDQFVPNKLILLLGGSSKKADFSYLASEMVKFRVRTYLYGKEGQTIKDALLAAGGENLILNYDQSGDFRQIIESAFKMAKPEDSIVLSPACASFDMFRNSKERGRLFKEIVNSL